jgi:hypothetical protein
MSRIIAAACAAMLAIPIFVQTVVAAPTCDGFAVTIASTSGDDVIHGTPGPDVINGGEGSDDIYGGGGRDRICGGVGNDDIYGEDGNDRLFGGSGNDYLNGGAGRDDLFGFDGNDVIRGGANPDYINGGNGFDNCRQQGGSGSVLNCEKADLKVDVSSPATAAVGPVTFTVKVKNNGPSATTYKLELLPNNSNVQCGFYPWEGITDKPQLAAGATRTSMYVITCADEDDPGGRVWLDALVLGDARDPNSANNTDGASTNLQ